MDRHGLAPYVGSLWRRREAAHVFPEQVRERLEETRQKTVYANLHLFASVRPLLARLHERGITPIVLKGCVLLGRAYPDTGARFLSDVDLLIREDRIVEARGVLEEQGLRHVPGTLRAGRRTDYKAEGPAAIMVDIHWDLSQRHRYQADLDGVWERSVSFDLEGVPVRRLAPADEFVYLALHYAAHYFGVTLKWLVDLRELIRYQPPEPEKVSRCAIRWRGRSGLHFALRYLREVYPDLSYADELARRVSSPLRDRIIGPFLSEDPLLLVKDRKRGPARLLLGLLFMDRPADMLRLGWATLVAPRDEEGGQLGGG
jgi:hypothetical protein